MSCALCLSSCSGLSTSFNPATSSQETTIYSTDREVAIGAAVAREIEEGFVVVEDVPENERLGGVLGKLVPVVGRRDLVHVAKVIDPKEKDKKPGEDVVNAVSLPGGYVYVFLDLMRHVKEDDQLAAVVAHELAHVVARHSIKRLQASYANIVAVVSAMQVDGRLAGGINAATNAMFFQYSQADELEADALGVKYLKAAGYDPGAMVRMLETLREYDRKQPIRPKYYGRTHPYVHQRIAAANQVITGEMSYRDWVRMTGEGADGR
ncbi:MAG: M48 family metalloprotease [Elusimicrobia bacterium]|nr:M48 family metalloprotease [Elusimicrobiota bacterium]